MFLRPLAGPRSSATQKTSLKIHQIGGLGSRSSFSWPTLTHMLRIARSFQERRLAPRFGTSWERAESWKSTLCAAGRRESSYGLHSPTRKSPPCGGRGKSYYRPKGAGSDSVDEYRSTASG